MDPDFGRQLEARHRRVRADEDCVLFDLTAAPAQLVPARESKSPVLVEVSVGER